MNLQIENPYKISDNAFVITVNGQEYEYEIPEDKDINQIIERIETWLDRGEDSWGGLYDWIKASFKMVGEYEQPIEEDEGDDLEDPLLAPSMGEQPTSIDIPSDVTDTDEVIEEENALELQFKIEEDSVNISIDDWAADFEVVDTTEKFTDILTDKVKEEMTLKDRTSLLVELIRNLDTDDDVNYYNLINLLLNTDVEIVDNFEQAEEDTTSDLDVEEPSLDDEPATNEEPNEEVASPEEETTNLEEPVNDSQILTVKGTFKKALVEDSLWDGSNKDFGYDTIKDRDEDDMEEDGPLTLEDLIINDGFLEDLVSLDLHLYAITSEDKKDTLYFIGGINDKGCKYSLNYDGTEPIELPDTFDECKNIHSELGQIEDLNTVINYIDKLLEIVYNQQAKKIHKNIEGEDDEQE